MGNSLDRKTTLTLFEAAQLLSDTIESERDTEIMLAEAMERGELRADIKRWATEQWDGKQLPGNINCLETHIQRQDLEAWLKGKGWSV